jgi:hypothetical protein
MSAERKSPRPGTEGSDKMTGQVVESLPRTMDSEGRRSSRRPGSPRFARSQPSGRADSPASVAQSVARILDGLPTPEEHDLPRALQEIARIRSGARRILEGRLAAEDEDALLGALARRGARAELPDFALEAILAELAEPQPPPNLLPTTVIGRLRYLRRDGRDSCPTCLRLLPSESALDHHDLRARWYAEDVARFRGAAPMAGGSWGGPGGSRL